MTVDQFIAQVVAEATIPSREAAERVWRLLPAVQPGSVTRAASATPVPSTPDRAGGGAVAEWASPDLRRAS